MAGNHLPSDMVLAYKRYKRDTEAVAGWLAEKATQLGYVAATSTSLPKQPKLKGRARKLARDAAKQAASPPIEPKYSYAVKTTEFVGMASKIVNARPKIILSRPLRAIWERAIRVRRDFSAWFKSRDSIDPLADEKHSHFTTVLEAALEILKPCYEQLKTPQPESKVKQESEETNLEQLNNMFQHLDVEDTTSDEEPDQAESTVPKPVPSVAPRAQIDFDDEEAEAEFLFAIWSFLQDVTAVRVYVACNWQLYSAGTVELMQAASVTNLAVDLVRRAEADFEATLQRPPKYPASKFPTGSLPFLIFKLHLPAANGGRALDFDPDQASTIIICGCEICDMLMYMPWVMAKNYIEVLQEIPPTFPTSNNDFRVETPGFYPASVPRSEYYHAKNPSQKAETQLHEIFPTCCMLSLMLRRGFVEDEILHAARHILENHNVPLWVSFAFQVQLDIQRLDSLKSIPAFKDLKEAYAETKSRHKEHRKWSQPLGLEIWDQSSEDHVHSIVKEFGAWIEGTRCGLADQREINSRLAQGDDIAAALNNSGRVPLLELFPLTCGTMKTEMTLEWHVLGLRLVNNAGHVIMLCHLYNALRSINDEAPTWPDMELLIRNQDPARIFVGTRPNNLEDAYKRIFLAMGMSAGSLARDSSGMTFKKKNAKRHEYQKAPIAGNLFDRWMGKESRKVDEAAYHLQQMLSDGKYKHDLLHKLFVLGRSESDDGKALSKLVLLNTKMVRTLVSLSHGFTAEMPAFMFDYFSMQRQCFSIFQQLREAYRTRLEKHDGPFSKQADKTNNPVSLTLSVIGSARDVEQMTRNMRSNKAENKARGPALAKHIKSQLVGFTDENSQDLVDEVLQLTKQGRAAEVLQKYMDISEHAMARNTFQPMLATLQKFLNAGDGDREIRKLRRRVRDTSYGIFLFRNASLQALYGSQPSDAWKDIAISEDHTKSVLSCGADEPALVVLTILCLRQKKVMCGEGEDSHEASLLRDFSASELEKYAASRRRKPKPAEAPEVKEDWEKIADIYGKEGRDAKH
ncbi:hypothetical protein LTS15_007416 [Exophiala xenobiotica]|nr:hypothetical protein LTS15_007416 [Exophiala xenobiotica]